MRVTVYGSSSARTPTKYLEAATQVGRGLAQRGWTLVNGAGKDGCMGAMTSACLAAGGRVDGVILRRFAEQGLQHPDLSNVQVADTMPVRKQLLATGADAFITLPGGPGTWEELWEIAVQRQIGNTTAPLIVIDIDGFYAGFRAVLQRSEHDGLLYGPATELMTWAIDSESALAVLDGFLLRR